MSETEPTRPVPAADWEAFYRNFRKPGYVPGFEITSRLGGGMFGLVFKATRQSIGKDYAIKFLKVDDGEVRRAVLQELEQVRYFAQIDHPNLVSIEDRGEVDGIPYLVMAYAGAETLRDRLPGELAGDRTELLRLFLQACRGVAALHERSLVHFDLKPANVFLKGGVARVGDYGLSKLVTHSRGSLSMGRGTPFYMAPEMLQRRGDHRSDVYSLGVLLYEVLCGDVPFRGDSEWEVLRKHETERVAFPARIRPRERAIVERCMQKDPARRFQSVHDLIAVLGAPVGAGAAAWQEARQGMGNGTRPPIDGPWGGAGSAAGPARGAGVPPPLRGNADDDPYAGLRKATREACTHAGKIAQRAFAKAQKFAGRAGSDARKAMREAMAQSRRKHVRRWGAWRRLRQMRREERRRAREAARAARRARVRRWFRGGSALLATGLLVVCGYLLLAGDSGTAGRAPQAQRVAGLWVPEEYEGAVATREPEWVLLARRDPFAAREVLQAHVEHFEARAPLRGDQRAAAGRLPRFPPIQVRVDDAQFDEVMREVGRLAAGDVYDEDLAAGLRSRGLPPLLYATVKLDGLSTADEQSLREAAHLDRFLRESTGYDGICIASERGLPAAERAVRNRELGRLWRWYLHEVGFSPRTWQVYCQLREVAKGR